MDIDFIRGHHPHYSRFHPEWKLNYLSYHDGTQYRNAGYLRKYKSDEQTSSNTVKSFDIYDDGTPFNVQHLPVFQETRDVDSSLDEMDRGFYGEKLQNAVVYNGVRLIVNEYSSMLFRDPPQRQLPELSSVQQFIQNVDGEDASINEFQRRLDKMVTIFGVCHVGVYLMGDKPRWRIHTPLDITNWNYVYDHSGELVLDQVCILLDSTADWKLYRYMTPDTISTVWVGEQEDFQPDNAADYTDLGDGAWMFSQPNPLGYVPLVTLYQEDRQFHNVGSTVISSASRIQLSMYNDDAELYASKVYSLNPVLVVDEDTYKKMNGQIGAEAGTVVVVGGGPDASTGSVVRYETPDMGPFEVVQDSIRAKQEAQAYYAMLRSEDLVKASTSGEHIQQYDDKLASHIRSKATNMENAEFRAWQITLDWLGELDQIDQVSVTYNRKYNKRAVSEETAELKEILNTAALVDESIIRLNAGNPESGQLPLTLDSEFVARIQQRLRDLANSTDTRNGV